MRTPCEWTLQEFVPRVRSYVVKELHDKQYKQTEIAKLTGISQPRVSHYLKNPRSLKINRNMDLPQLQLIQVQLAEAVTKTATKIVIELENGKQAPETIPIICQSCRELRMGNALCTLHKMDYKELNDIVGDKTCDLCLKWKTVSPPHTMSIESLDSRRDVLTTLETVANAMLMQLHFTEYLPQIGSQFCMIFNQNTNEDENRDVAGFPGRIIRFKGRAKVVSSPEYYGSISTAQLLIEFRKNAKNITSVLSIKNLESQDFEQNLETHGFVLYKTVKGDTEGLLSQIHLLKKSNKYAILDSGGLGYEPIAYLFTEDPKSLLSVFS